MPTSTFSSPSRMSMRFHKLNSMLFSALSCIFSCFLLLIAGSNVSWAQTKVVDNTAADNTKRLNTSLRLMTHSQRAVKLYYQAVLNVELDQTRPKINESISIISNNLDKLQSDNLTGPALTYLKEADATWSSMVRQVSGAPSKEGADAVQKSSAKLLDSLEKLTAELAKAKKSSNSDIVVLVNSQIALSQRIARNYFAMHIGLAGNSNKARLIELLKRFTTIQEELEAFASTNAKLKDDFDLIKVQLLFFKNILERADVSNKNDLVSMAKISGRLLEVLGRMEVEFAK
jgi:hypothetical protein